MQPPDANEWVDALLEIDRENAATLSADRLTAEFKSQRPASAGKRRKRTNELPLLGERDAEQVGLFGHDDPRR